MEAQIERIRCGLVVLLAGCFLTGCFAPKSYVAPEFRHATYENLEPKTEPLAVLVDVMFQVNGKDKPAVVAQVRPKVSRILRASRVVSDHAALASAPRLSLVINNIGDLSDARAKGVAAGLTFGAAGVAVSDFYEMTASFTTPEGVSTKKLYKHAIHSTIGAHAAPKGVELVPPETAFERVLEDMLLNFLVDLQKEKVL